MDPKRINEAREEERETPAHRGVAKPLCQQHLAFHFVQNFEGFYDSSECNYIFWLPQSTFSAKAITRCRAPTTLSSWTKATLSPDSVFVFRYFVPDTQSQNHSNIHAHKIICRAANVFGSPVTKAKAG